MKPTYRLTTILLVASLLISMAGCCKTQIVRTSLTPIPESIDNILFVAAGEPIRVGIEGSEEYITVDVDGYYLIHISDLRAMVNVLKKAHELEQIK